MSQKAVYVAHPLMSVIAYDNAVMSLSCFHNITLFTAPELFRLFVEFPADAVTKLILCLYRVWPYNTALLML
jgi:hypothetical protein